MYKYEKTHVNLHDVVYVVYSLSYKNIYIYIYIYIIYIYNIYIYIYM